MKIKKLAIYAGLLATLSFTVRLVKKESYYNSFIEEVEKHSECDNHDGEIVAHRGFSSLYSENSIDSVIAALNSDCVDEIEVDLRLTKDNKIVLIHNECINLNCNGSGKVKNKNLSKIQSYEYHGANYMKFDISSPDMKLIYDRNKHNIKNITQIVTLEEILKCLNGNKILILDVKIDENEDEMINELIKILNSYKGNLNIKIQSSDIEFLDKIRIILPNYEYQVIIKNKEGLQYIESDYDSLVIKNSLLNEDVLEKCIESDKKIYIWTINDYNEYVKLRKKLSGNFDNIYIVTDNPDEICYLNNCSNEELKKIKRK